MVAIGFPFGQYLILRFDGELVWVDILQYKSLETSLHEASTVNFKMNFN